jgi:hypothetical protein
MQSPVETLEPRTLMAASLPAVDINFYQGGLLVIRNAHQIRVQEFHDGAGHAQVVVSGPTENYGTFLGITAIVITGTAAADTITLYDDDIPALVSSGDGDDVVAVFGNGPAVVYGGNGNDTLLVGRNTLVLPSRGTDTVESSEF